MEAARINIAKPIIGFGISSCEDIRFFGGLDLRLEFGRDGGKLNTEFDAEIIVHLPQLIACGQIPTIEERNALFHDGMYVDINL